MDQFESFNRVAKELQNYPQLAGDDLAACFQDIDHLLQQGVRLLLANTHFVEDTVCFYLSGIASGSLKTKLYRGRFVKKRQQVGQGVEVGAENSRIFAVGFDLFKLSRVTRDVAKPLVLRVLRSLRLQNLTYEHILRAFAYETKNYLSICVDLALAQQRLREMGEDEEAHIVQQVQYISDLRDQRAAIESKVGCVDPQLLYGTVAQAHALISRIDRVQTKIVEAYLKSIPRVVREYAQSDLDAHDLLQAGSFGLLHAVRVYDYRSRAGFARFARTWIRQRIRGHLRESGGPGIRLAPSVWEAYQEILRTELALKSKHPGVEPTREEVAARLGWDLSKVEETLRRVTFCRVGSLDAPAETAEGGEVLEREETIAEVYDEDTETEADILGQLEQIIDHLTPENRRLICFKYGCLDLINNDDLDLFQAFDENLRQLACKILLHRQMAGRIDSVRSVSSDTTGKENEVAK